MAAQADGFWFDFTQTDRLFQENVGPTPAAAPNDVIGLSLSQRLWNGASLAAYAAAQPELVSNGDFASSAGWAAGAGWTIGSGVATAAATSSNLSFTGVSPTTGRLYKVEFDWTHTSGTLFVAVGFGAAATTNTTGRKVFYLTCGATAAAGITFYGGTVSGVLDNVTVKEVSRYPAQQATASFKPKFQTTGASFDGTDDNLLTGYLASATANFFVAKVTVPLTLAGLQYFAGAWDGANGRCLIGFNTSGNLVAGVGTQNAGVIKDIADYRGQEVVVGLSFDGTTVRLFANGALVYEAAQSGTPTTSVPLRLGALNSSDSALNFFGGSIARIVVGREFINLARFNQISAAL